jgi:Zn-dependent M16 (insulinase) family peptidase
MDPSSRGYIAMIRGFTGLSDDDRLKFRNSILDMTPEQLQDAASRYFAAAIDSAVVAVYSSSDNLQKANDVLGQTLTIEALT